MDLYAPRHLLIDCILLVVVLWPFAKIFSRAGYSRWLVVLMIIPLVNIATLWWFAYGAKWKVAPPPSAV